MNTKLKLVALLLLSSAVPRLSALEALGPPESVVLETTAASRYLWRGWVVNDSATLQPAVTVGWRGFSFSTWHSFSRHVPNNQAWTEHDLSLTYSRTLRRWTLSGGFSAFLFPDKCSWEGNRTYEASVGVSYKHWLQPSLTFSHDFEVGKGNYYFASVSHTFPVRRWVDLTGQIGVGLNQHQYQPVTTVSDFDAVLSSGIHISPRVTLTPSFTQMTGNRSLFGSHGAFALKLAVRARGGEE